jgi:hypothetical protein
MPVSNPPEADVVRAAGSAFHLCFFDDGRENEAADV